MHIEQECLSHESTGKLLTSGEGWMNSGGQDKGYQFVQQCKQENSNVVEE